MSTKTDKADQVFIRGLNPDEWEDLLAIRIRALEMHPGFFMSTPEKAKALTSDEWKKRINCDGQRLFGLFDTGTLIGITGIFIDLNYDPSGKTAHMVMSFIEPRYRGQGFANLFYKARIDWALKQKGVKKILTGHRSGNEPSKRTMLAHGFQYIKEEHMDWPDGQNDINVFYELDLENLRDKP